MLLPPRLLPSWPCLPADRLPHQHMRCCLPWPSPLPPLVDWEIPRSPIERGSPMSLCLCDLRGQTTRSCAARVQRMEIMKQHDGYSPREGSDGRGR